MPKLRQNQHGLRQIATYLVSGGAYFWSGYAWFFLAYQTLGWSLWWAKLSANALGLTINYILQRYWVFRTAQGQTPRITSRYLIISGLDFVLDYLIVYSLQAGGLTPYLGQFVSSGFFTIWNYYWYKFWVFTRHSPSSRV